MTMLYRLAMLDLPRPAALRAVLYATAFPFAYFFGVVYSESLFLLALVSTVYALRTRRWLMAALAGAVMTATRVTGVMALPGLAWMAWRSCKDEQDRMKALTAVAGACAGIGAFSLYNFLLSGRSFAWYEAITFWNYHPGAIRLPPSRVCCRLSHYDRTSS